MKTKTGHSLGEGFVEKNKREKESGEKEWKGTERILFGKLWEEGEGRGRRGAGKGHK